MLFGRRVTFAIFVLASQIMLIALGIAWIIHMVLIAKNGKIYFIEENPAILLAEIAGTVFITLFATAVFAIQIYRLGERRRGDERKTGDEERKAGHKS